jgi:hypothetical protein
VLVGIAMGHLIRFFPTQNGIIAYKCCQPMNTIIKRESLGFHPRTKFGATFLWLRVGGNRGEEQR